jgi:hypothetical protein
LIDAALDPYISEGWAVTLDSLLHLLVERDDLPGYLRKLVKYDLKHILAALRKRKELKKVLRIVEEILRALSD